MAIVQTGKRTKGQYSVATGTSASGKTIYSTRSISNINPLATDVNLYNWLSGIASLQLHALNEVKRVDTVVLVED